MIFQIQNANICQFTTKYLEVPFPRVSYTIWQSPYIPVISFLVKHGFHYVTINIKQPLADDPICYTKTNCIPVELSRENMISSHVKIAC